MVNSLVSIILPVYNGESTISASIESILQQSYQNFELIIIDDGSSDNSLKQMKQFKDKRIIINTQNNNGLAKTLNYGISVAKGELIARQDQDDISLPTRIEKQVERFYANKKLVLLGTNALVINENNQ
jgi:glycosyltransferase involved in cell wall biosynthesis